MWVETRRTRLASVSWFMRILKQCIARRANREDGQIPEHLKPILERLQIDVDSWLEVMLSHGRFVGTAVGALVHLSAEVGRRGITWIADKTRIHKDRRKRAPPKLTPVTG